MWTIWILASAVALAFYDLSKKASVRGNAVLPVLLISSCCGCCAFAAALAARGGIGAALHAPPSLLAFAFAKSAIVATSWIFTFCALRTLPISIATPIRASSPALVFLLAFFLYGEVPTFVQAVGMLAVFVGYWVFSWAGRHEGIDFLRSRAVWCAFAGTLCSAFSSIWDKYLFQVRGFPVDSMQLWYQLGLFLFYAVLFSVQRVSGIWPARFEWRWTIPCTGVLLAFADWLYFNGLAVPEVPISIASLLRRASVVITFALGAWCFHETNLRRKALALLVIITGIVLLVV